MDDIGYASFIYYEGTIKMQENNDPRRLLDQLYPDDADERREDARKRRAFYKTKAEKKNNDDTPKQYCESWLNGRTCRYGNRCWYNHGPINILPKRNKTPTIKKDIGLTPTPAQKQWMMMSSSSDENETSHQAILLGNRQNSHKKSIQTLMGQADENQKENENRQNSLKKNISMLSSEKQRENQDRKFSQKKHIPRLYRQQIEIQPEKKEICALYSICGVCPLEDDCWFKHELLH